MNVLWDDLVNELVHQVQDKVVPTLEQVSKNAAERLLRKPRPPPTTTDLVYLTDRLIVSSQPALAWPTPAYTDVGRDERRPWRIIIEENDDEGGESSLEQEQGRQRQSQEPSSPKAQTSKEDSLLRGPDETLSQVPESSSSMEEDSKAETATPPEPGESSSPSAPSPSCTSATENPQDGGPLSSPAAASAKDPNTGEPSKVGPLPETATEPASPTAQTTAVSPTNDTSTCDHPPSESSLSSPSPSTSSPPLCNGETDSQVLAPLVGMESVDVPSSGDNQEHAKDLRAPTIEESSDHVASTSRPMSIDPDTPSTPENTTESLSGQEEGESSQLASPATLGEDENAEVDDPMDQELQVVVEGEASSEPPITAPQHPPPPASALRNSPAAIATYLEKRHGKERFLAFSLTDHRPDDRTLLLFRRQIVQMGWWSPCKERSETPSISQMLKLCYAIHAYLQLDPSNVALIYCANGKTRSAIALACYLKFAGFCSYSREGFLLFLTKRGISNPDRTWEQLPPSLHLFFRQFDTALHLGGFLNRKPLLLRAIALQGIPVEDKPCLDIWDSSQKHVYTSHPEIMWQANHGRAAPNNQNHLSQWADEEGFYRVNVVLEGDFLLLCRFGGDFAEDATIHDPSKILFRYANTTGFLSGGYPYELTPDRVDLSRRYAPHLDDEDFLVTLLFEANWERLDDETGDDGEHVLAKNVVQQLGANSPVASERIYRCHESVAFQEGLRLIVQHHSARPSRIDLDDFRKINSEKHLEGCEDHLVCIALQLTNFDLQGSVGLLLHSPAFSWWKSRALAQLQTKEEASNFKWKRNMVDSKAKSSRYGLGSAASKEILNLLDEVNVESTLEKPDRLQLQRSAQVDGTSMHARPPSSVAKHFQKADPLNLSLSDSYVRNSGWMVPSMMYPRQGDIVGSFSEHYRQFHQLATNETHLPSVVAMTKPLLPCFPRNKPALIPPPHPKRQRRKEATPIREFVPRHSNRESSIQLHRVLHHSQVELSELMDLIDVSQTWTDMPLVSDDESVCETEKPSDEVVAVTSPSGREASMNREAKEQQQKKWEDAKKAEAKEKEKQLVETSRKKDEDEARRKEQGNDTAPTNGDEIPLKDDPEFVKYFKMLKMGLPKEQVLHAMTRDEKDQTVLDLDPNKSLKSQRPEGKASDGDVPLNEDPEYTKYFKMLKMGLPVDAVKNAMTRDGKDPTIMDLDPNKSVKSQVGGGPDNDVDAGPPLKDDPEYAKYFKMLKMGLPVDAVKNAMTRDGKDPTIMDLDPNKSVKSQVGGGPDNDADTGPPLKDDPEYAKYFKMLKMGLPVDAVKNAMTRDGKDPMIMDLDPTKSARSQLGAAAEKDTGIPLKDDPEYSKYFKMLSMGLPPGAVQNALERDGKNPGILDMDPTKSVAFQMKKGSAGKKPAKKKKRVRRKKIYWNPIDPSKLKEDSMWSIVRGAIAMNTLKYDQKEFEDLFTESADPADQKNKKKDEKKEQKKLVQVIDPKRSMNGGIVLARLKTDHSKIAEYVNRMDHAKFDATQLKALKEYLPDADERRGLIVYMKKGDASKEVWDKLYADCSETEKYMVTMIDVEDAGAKLDAMLFRSIFKHRFEETTEGIRILNNACDELRSSEKLRKLMAMILTVVNQINTGGEGKMAMGFTLDALLKLNEAKAFDKKTSVLHYVVKLVKKNDSSLIAFDRDLLSVVPAESVLLDGLNTDIKLIAEELKGVHEIAKQEGDRLEQAGELKPMSLSELAEQRTSVRTTGGVMQFNKMDHLTGRTSMERFSLNANVACEQASESIENIKKKYRAVLQYFGEDEQMATSDFFGTLRRFMNEWKKAVEQVEAIENKEAKEKKRTAAKAARAKKEVGNGGKKKVGRFPASAPSRQKQTEGKGRGVAAASAVSRKGSENDDLFGLGAAASLKKNERGHSDAGPHSRGANTNGEKLPAIDEKLNEVGTSIRLSAESSKFSAKAAACRRKNEDNEDSKSDFLSAAMAYRRKKSQRDLTTEQGVDSSGDHGTNSEAKSLISRPVEEPPTTSTTEHESPGIVSRFENAQDNSAVFTEGQRNGLDGPANAVKTNPPGSNEMISNVEEETSSSPKPASPAQMDSHSPEAPEQEIGKAVADAISATQLSETRRPSESKAHSEIRQTVGAAFNVSMEQMETPLAEKSKSTNRADDIQSADQASAHLDLLEDDSEQAVVNRDLPRLGTADREVENADDAKEEASPSILPQNIGLLDGNPRAHSDSMSEHLAKASSEDDEKSHGQLDENNDHLSPRKVLPEKETSKTSVESQSTNKSNAEEELWDKVAPEIASSMEDAPKPSEGGTMPNQTSAGEVADSFLAHDNKDLQLVEETSVEVLGVSSVGDAPIPSEEESMSNKKLVGEVEEVVVTDDSNDLQPVEATSVEVLGDKLSREIVSSVEDAPEESSEEESMPNQKLVGEVAEVFVPRDSKDLQPAEETSVEVLGVSSVEDAPIPSEEESMSNKKLVGEVAEVVVTDDSNDLQPVEATSVEVLGDKLSREIVSSVEDAPEESSEKLVGEVAEVFVTRGSNDLKSVEETSVEVLGVSSVGDAPIPSEEESMSNKKLVGEVAEVVVTDDSNDLQPVEATSVEVLGDKLSREIVSSVEDAPEESSEKLVGEVAEVFVTRDSNDLKSVEETSVEVLGVSSVGDAPIPSEEESMSNKKLVGEVAEVVVTDDSNDLQPVEATSVEVLGDKLSREIVSSVEDAPEELSEEESMPNQKLVGEVAEVFVPRDSKDLQPAEETSVEVSGDKLPPALASSELEAPKLSVESFSTGETDFKMDDDQVLSQSFDWAPANDSMDLDTRKEESQKELSPKGTHHDGRATTALTDNSLKSKDPITETPQQDQKEPVEDTMRGTDRKGNNLTKERNVADSLNGNIVNAPKAEDFIIPIGTPPSSVDEQLLADDHSCTSSPSLPESNADEKAPSVDEDDIFHDSIPHHDKWDAPDARADSLEDHPGQIKSQPQGAVDSPAIIDSPEPNIDSTFQTPPSEAPISFISAADGRDLESFFDAEEIENLSEGVASPDADDASAVEAMAVGIMADYLQKKNLIAQLSDSWAQGDTIQNFMGWADQAIKASDTESVRNFEISRDLNDNDFDDESTIATLQDDASIVSWNTPSRNTSYTNLENMSGRFDIDPPFEVAVTPAATPARVAASILFNDSPGNSAEQAPVAPNLRHAPDQDILDMGLSIPTNDFGLDAGLAFGVEDAGLDDGLGFGLSYGGNDDSFDAFADAHTYSAEEPTEEPKSPQRKSWFRWGT